jgi:hypothetical protein
MYGSPLIVGKIRAVKTDSPALNGPTRMGFALYWARPKNPYLNSGFLGNAKKL